MYSREAERQAPVAQGIGVASPKETGPLLWSRFFAQPAPVSFPSPATVNRSGNRCRAALSGTGSLTGRRGRNSRRSSPPVWSTAPVAAVGSSGASRGVTKTLSRPRRTVTPRREDSPKPRRSVGARASAGESPQLLGVAESPARQHLGNVRASSAGRGCPSGSLEYRDGSSPSEGLLEKTCKSRSSVVAAEFSGKEGSAPEATSGFFARASATRASPVHCFWPPRGPTRLFQRVRVAALNCLVRAVRHQAVGAGAFCRVVVVGRVVVGLC